MSSTIEIEPTLHHNHGPCPHCGGEAQSVWAANSPLASEVFEYLDRIVIDDSRVARFVGTGEGMDGYGTRPPRRAGVSWSRFFRRDQ